MHGDEAELYLLLEIELVFVLRLFSSQNQKFLFAQSLEKKMKKQQERREGEYIQTLWLSDNIHYGRKIPYHKFLISRTHFVTAIRQK